VASRAEQEFNRETVAGAARLKREIGYNPTRFNRMVSDYGGVGAARRLLTGRDASDGFTTLWEHRRLEMSVEAIALLPWYTALFTEDERATARRRLVEHDFDVDSFLIASAAAPPPWLSSDDD
jgi:hypothetical protein